MNLKNIKNDLSAECSFPEAFEENNGTDLSPDYPRRIGHIRADYDGYRWWNTIWWHHKEFCTKEIALEMDAVYEALTGKDGFTNLEELRSYCNAHPQAHLSGDRSYEYVFYYEGELCYYWIRFFTCKGDYNIYLNTFVKKEGNQNAV